MSNRSDLRDILFGRGMAYDQKEYVIKQIEKIMDYKQPKQKTELPSNTVDAIYDRRRKKKVELPDEVPDCNYTHRPITETLNKVIRYLKEKE